MDYCYTISKTLDHVPEHLRMLVFHMPLQIKLFELSKPKSNAI